MIYFQVIKCAFLKTTMYSGIDIVGPSVIRKKKIKLFFTFKIERSPFLNLFISELAVFIWSHNCITWLTWTQRRQKGGYFIISASSTLFIKDVLPSLGLPIMAANQISVPF